MTFFPKKKTENNLYIHYQLDRGFRGCSICAKNKICRLICPVIWSAKNAPKTEYIFFSFHSNGNNLIIIQRSLVCKWNNLSSSRPVKVRALDKYMHIAWAVVFGKHSSPLEKPSQKSSKSWMVFFSQITNQMLIHPSVSMWPNIFSKLFPFSPQSALHFFMNLFVQNQTEVCNYAVAILINCVDRND